MRISNLAEHRNLCFQNQRRQSVKDGTSGRKHAREYNKGKKHEVGMLWSEPERSLPKNCSSALSRLYSQERRFQRDPILSLYQQSIDTNVEKRFVKILDECKAKGTFGKEWHMPHHPVLNPNKPGIVRWFCSAALKYKEVCLNDELLAAADLLHGLGGTIFRFREEPIALTADIESMF